VTLFETPDRRRPVPPMQKPRHPTWTTAGIVLAVLFAIFGLALVAAAVAFVIGLSSWGSNK
jgi:hypothetical protein